MYNIAIEVMTELFYARRTGILAERSVLAFRSLMPLMMLGACILGAGCGSSNTIWREEVRSPDGLWLASADTVQNGGFGSAAIDTRVYLEMTNGSKPRKDVLLFLCDGPAARPNVLDNVANRGGTIDLRMKWISPSHLEVTYNGRASVNLQLTNYDGIEISLQVPSSGANTDATGSK